MEWYEPEVRQLERSIARHKRRSDLVVFYGSSTVRLWNTLSKDLATTRALNLGFGGSTLAACDYFFGRLVAPVNPCSLVLYAGDNDLGDGASPEEVFGSFQALADKVQKIPEIREFGFVSIKPSPARTSLLDRVRATNTCIREEVARRNSGYYIDVFHAMLSSDGQPRPELFQDDGLHMNEAGYRLWTEELSRYRNRIFTTNCRT